MRLGWLRRTSTNVGAKSHRPFVEVKLEQSCVGPAVCQGEFVKFYWLFPFS